MVKMINTSEITKRCLLCQDNVADKTGSHIIPNFLIQSAFGLDKHNGRNREFIVSFDLVPEFHFGHELIPEKIESILGRELTDDEIERKFNNPFVKDHVFCSECEKKFGEIESVYADARIKTEANPSVYISKLEPHLSHLFWLSVVWRISATNYPCIISSSIEEKIRRILKNCLSIKLTEVPDKGYYINQMSNFGYYLIYFREDGICKGGYYPPSMKVSPAKIFFINNYVLLFYSNANNFRNIPEFFGLERDLNANNFNKATQPEKYVLFDSLAYHCVIDNYEHLKIKEFINNIKETVTKGYDIECSDSVALRILSEYTNGVNTIAEFIALNEEKLLKAIEKVLKDS